MLPKGASQAVVDHYAKLFEAAANDPKVVEAMNANGTSVNYLGPDAATSYWSDTFTKWKAIAQEVGIYKAGS